MQVLTYIIVVGVIVGVCLLAMSIGLIFRNKTFTSCGCASAKFQNEDIRCPACPGKDTGEPCDRQKKSETQDVSVS